MQIKLSALAEKLGLEYSGEDFEISGVNTLDKAGPDEISFLVNPKYAQQLDATGPDVFSLPARMSTRLTGYSSVPMCIWIWQRS